jgi:hypothetical protein
VRIGPEEEECDDDVWDDIPLGSHCLAGGCDCGGDGMYSNRGSLRRIPSTTAGSSGHDCGNIIELGLLLLLCLSIKTALVFLL